jgi:hypothetical protein
MKSKTPAKKTTQQKPVASSPAVVETTKQPTPEPTKETTPAHAVTEPVAVAPAVTEPASVPPAVTEPVAPTPAPVTKEAAKPKTKEPAPKKEKAPSISAEVRKIVVRRPALTNAEIAQTLIDDGWDAGDVEKRMSTIATLRTDALAIIAIAKEAGLWKV